VDAERLSYVALLDVLGFKDMVQDSDLRELAVVLREIGAAEHYPDVKSIQFSDSILLYTEGVEDTKLRQIVGHATYLILESLDRKIGLRGGITRGKFLHDGTVFLGPAMVRAYELEQMQDWIGGIIDPELASDEKTVRVLNDLEDMGFLVRYEAPIKGGSVGQLRCLDWPTIDDHCPVVETRGSRQTSWDVMRKLANTNKFRNFAIKRRASA
jgi:hypothetical protein